MSELAFNANGETFEVPATVSGWRVRRMKPRGAPELVYGRDGRPLVIPIESNTDDLRDAVSAVGKYRLDPVNEDGRTVDGVPAAYVQVVKLGDDDAPLTPSQRGASDDPIREAMRSNTELARTIVDRFPDMMTAAAELLRAADGAGLPARQGRMVADLDDETDEEEQVVDGAFDLNAFVGQLVPVLVAGFAEGKLKLPNLAAMLDWRKATPAPPKRSRVTAKDSDHADAGESKPSGSIPPLDPQTMAHFMAVQAVLSPEEAAIARGVAAELSPSELRTWVEELRALSVADAVTKVRALIAGRKAVAS